MTQSWAAKTPDLVTGLDARRQIGSDRDRTALGPLVTMSRWQTSRTRPGEPPKMGTDDAPCVCSESQGGFFCIDNCAEIAWHA
jgi:hypothetical protein